MQKRCIEQSRVNLKKQISRYIYGTNNFGTSWMHEGLWRLDGSPEGPVVTQTSPSTSFERVGDPNPHARMGEQAEWLGARDWNNPHVSASNCPQVSVESVELVCPTRCHKRGNEELRSSTQYLIGVTESTRQLQLL